MRVGAAEECVKLGLKLEQLLDVGAALGCEALTSDNSVALPARDYAWELVANGSEELMGENSKELRGDLEKCMKVMIEDSSEDVPKALKVIPEELEEYDEVVGVQDGLDDGGQRLQKQFMELAVEVLEFDASAAGGTADWNEKVDLVFWGKNSQEGDAKIVEGA